MQFRVRESEKEYHWVGKFPPTDKGRKMFQEVSCNEEDISDLLYRQKLILIDDLGLLFFSSFCIDSQPKICLQIIKYHARAFNFVNCEIVLYLCTQLPDDRATGPGHLGIS